MAEHNYINILILKDFSKSITLDDISKDFDAYEISNIMGENDEDGYSDYEEYRYYLEEAIYDDYVNGRANYRSYIEKGMNARFMMELRKSAILPLSEELWDFYTVHKDCETIEDIKNLRIQRLKFINDTYYDLDWQLYMLLRHYWGPKGRDIIIDYECCFADGDYRKMGNPDTYRADWLAQHIPPERLKWIV